MRSGVGKVINTETAFVSAVVTHCWAFSKVVATGGVAAYLIFVQGLIAIIGGFWWKRYKQQVIGGNGTSLTSTLTAQDKVDPLMEERK